MAVGISIEDLGLSKEDIQERVIERVCEQLLADVDYDENGDPSERPSKFKAAMQKRIVARIDSSIDEIAAKHVLPNIATYLENLCLQETNQWGEAKGKKITFVEYLVHRAEDYLTEKVDHNGKSQSEETYSWSGKQTRITHLVHQHLQYSIATAMKDALKTANSAIAKGIEETVKIKLAEVVASLQTSVSVKR